MTEKFCVGIDIGASAIKLCEFRRHRSRLEMRHFGAYALPPDTIVDGTVMNGARIVDGIRSLVSTLKVKNKRVALAVSGHAVIIKKILLPLMSDEELSQSLQWEAAQYVPFEIRDVYLDAQIVRRRIEQQQMDVLLVAARRDYVDMYRDLISEAGLIPTVCDVTPFALETLFNHSYLRTQKETIALIDVGASKTNLNILADGVSSFTRFLAVGGDSFTAEIQRQLNVGLSEAEALKLGGKNSNVAGQVVPQEVQRAMVLVAESLSNELQRSVDFFTHTHAASPPTRVYLSGGSAHLQLLVRIMQNHMRVPVEVFDPFKNIDAPDFEPSFLSQTGPASALAMGLALRYLGDEHAED